MLADVRGIPNLRRDSALTLLNDVGTVKDSSGDF